MSLHINDHARWDKFMKTMNEIADDGPVEKVYTFWVKDKGTNIIYECATRKRILSKDELYKVVISSLPDDVVPYELLGQKGGDPGHSFIRENTDVLETYNFVFYN